MARTPLSGTQHALRAGDYEAVIAGVGASLRSLTYRGRDLVVPFDADEVRPGHRGATLAPWPNRIVDGRYTFGGVPQQVALTEPARGHALHGLASWVEFVPVDKKPSHLSLEAVVEAQKGYPWRVLVRTTYTLTSLGLTQSVTAVNESEQPAPWGTSAHPYLVAGEGHVDDWSFELPAAQVLQVTPDRLIPTELTGVDADPARFDFRTARPIGSAEIDHAFTALAGDADGVVTARLTDTSGSGVEMVWDAACPWVQVFTSDQPGGEADPAHRAGVALEPMTCAPDAFNAERYPYDTGLITLEPGESATAHWRIGAID
ncbi:galactose mutarotase [Microbacterium protaetiae]|uniref:Galactose mutarotase n=1 Tax=Microbacterium protaetiae TaxID=2509458 RepID=A0A4P6EEV4_9MICO|nr:aldose 1-epimerase family protein [Microbacterium protaetiae]QAY60316.1 galactose mutarotase [Microbacterium protaetiae]